MTKKIIKAVTQGHNGEIDFEIEVEKNNINDIKVTQNSETPSIFNQVFGKLRSSILENQSFDVDAISGATIMTNALLKSGKVALKKANVSPIAKPKDESHQQVTLKADVAVIGSGAAGLIAACRAISMGKKVIVLEKNGYLGGATILNGSNVVGTGSKVSKKIFGATADNDSSELLTTDIARECRGTNYPLLSQLLANNIGKAVDFIKNFANLTYTKAETQTIEHSVERQIEMPSESSYEFIQKVAQAFIDKGGKIMLDSRVEKLVTDENDKLVSLISEGKHQTTTVIFNSLVLATGGYGAREYKYHQTKIPYYGPMTSTGDAYQFAQDMNLVTRNMDWYKIYPHGLETEPGIAKLTTYATKAVSDMGAIFVNTAGKRIVNESAPYTHFRDAIAAEQDKVAYIIMDQKMWDCFESLLLKYGFTKNELARFFALDGKKSPVLVKGNLKTVAQKAGIDASTLEQTVGDYQKNASLGKDPVFGRNVQFLHPFNGDIYYVIEQKLRFCTTLGGFESNEKMQLLNSRMSPVDNLYGAGELIGGANGHDSMPSMMNSWSYASGFVAGTESADNTNE